MGRIRKFAVVCVVWTTAASTLLGSTPYVICRCPNGQIKLFCAVLSVNNSSKSCCCNGSCCDSKGDKASCCNAKAVQKRSCCAVKNPEGEPKNTGKKGLAANNKSGEFRIFDGACCQKTLVKAKVSALNRAETKATVGSCTGLTLLAEAEPGFSVIVIPIAPPQDGWRVHR